MNLQPPTAQSMQLTAKFYDFLTNHSPSRLNRHFHTVFFDYLREQSQSDLPIDFYQYAWEFQDFFELLDLAIEEFAKVRV